MMGPSKNYVVITLVALLVADPTAPLMARFSEQAHEQVILRVLVQDDEKRPIRNVSIVTVGAGGTMITDNTGQGRVSTNAGYGDKVRLQISPGDAARWAFLNPLDGEVVVARSFTNVVLVRRDRDALRKRAVLEHIEMQGGAYEIETFKNLVAKAFGATPAELVAALGRSRNAAESSEAKLSAERLEKLFVEKFVELGSKVGDLASRISALENRPNLSGEERKEIQGLRQENQALRAQIERGASGSQRSQREAELEKQQIALMQKYEALLQRLNRGEGGVNVTYGPGSTSAAPVAGSGSAGKSLLALGGVVGGLAGIAALVKKFSPHADATFTTDCLAPCALIRSTTVARFQVTAPDIANFEYRWDFGDQRTDSGPSVTHLFFEDGTFTVTVTAAPNRSDSTATGATATGVVTVRSLTGLWRFASGNSQGSLQLSQGSTSVSGQYTIGSAAGNVSGTLTNPRAVRISVGFNGDSLDGTADAAVSVINGNYRIGATGAIQPFTLTRVQ